ncbi:28678_t:CDS:2 [Dentiscutata erythropus]|uniref:28678_t:CDS:1 n=1 Tax=Dentiscutata erythropus TaxID=1348616 RepID=A0A9N9FBK6_9GLOM|nr:28678_t:CDS:2 [Dentiscutata erythropus]
MNIVDASGFINSRSLNAPMKLFLKSFYLINTTQEFSIPLFEKENIILATGKFRIVEYINEKNEKLSALKIILSNIVHLGIEPDDLPKFSALVNMIAIVKEPPLINDDDGFMTVVMSNYIDQDQSETKIKCYYLATAPHLTRLTPAIKKNSILYINETEDSDSSSKAISFAEKIAAKFDNKHVTKNKSLVINLPVTKSPSKTEPYTQINTNKKSPVTKSFKTKPSSTPKLYTQTRSKHKLTDLAKNMLNNSNETN